VVLALGAAAFLVQSLRDRDDARAELAHARVQLHVARATSSNDARNLTETQRSVRVLHDQLMTITGGATSVAKLDDQDLDAVRTAVQSGLAGKLDDYNTAVDHRSDLDTEHDAALEQLREQVNAVIGALDQLTG